MKRVTESSSKIKAIIFDVGGVLQIGGRKKRESPKDVHISGVHEKMAKKLSITLDQYFDAIESAYSRSIEGQISKSILLGILSCNLNYPSQKIEKEFHRAYLSKFKKNKWMYKIILKLKKQGYKVAILSDQWHLSKDALIPKKDQGVFDEVALSCDIGMRKPHKESFDYILSKLKMYPNEVLFIDNQEWNVIAAEKLGMNTMLFVNNEKAKEQFRDFGINTK